MLPRINSWANRFNWLGDYFYATLNWISSWAFKGVSVSGLFVTLHLSRLLAICISFNKYSIKVLWACFIAINLTQFSPSSPPHPSMRNLPDFRPAGGVGWEMRVGCTKCTCPWSLCSGVWINGVLRTVIKATLVTLGWMSWHFVKKSARRQKCKGSPGQNEYC